jgi:hypothetical protein
VLTAPILGRQVQFDVSDGPDDCWSHEGFMTVARNVLEDVTTRGLLARLFAVRFSACASPQSAARAHRARLTERDARVGECGAQPSSPYAEYDLVIVGHSLGAAIASLLALLLRPTYPTLRCYAYAPPGCVLSAAAAKYDRAPLTLSHTQRQRQGVPTLTPAQAYTHTYIHAYIHTIHICMEGKAAPGSL